MSATAPPHWLNCPSCGQSLGVTRPNGAEWSVEQHDLLLRLRARGVSWKVLARLFGVAPDTLRHRADKLTPIRARRRGPVSEKRVRALAKARAARRQHVPAPLPPHAR